MLVQVRQEELTKRDNKIKNLTARVRNYELAKKTEEQKAAFSDADKLIILEGVLLAVVGTEALEPMTRILLARFSDDKFWSKHRHDNIEKILISLAKIGMN